MQWKSILRLAVSAAALGVSANAMAQAPAAGVTGHGDISGLPTPNIGVGFFDLSGDGTTIAGTVRKDATTYSAYRITASGYEALPGLSGDVYVLAKGVSDDGKVIVGISQSTYSSRGSAIIWEGTTGSALGHLATTAAFQNSGANGVSGDGKVAVGFSVTNVGASHAVRWVNKGNPEDLNGGGFSSSFAQRTSRDGSVIVGHGANATRTNEGFVWTQAAGMTGLGVLSAQSGDTGAYSRATDVSADGAVVVGFSAGSNDKAQAFRWTSSGGMVSLGLLPSGQDSRAYAVNADGSVIVGSATRPSAVVAGIQDTVAFRWTSGNGLQTIADWLTANGVAVGSNSFTDAKGISDDGRVVIGEGQINGTTQQYIARIAASGTGGGTSGGTTGGGTGGTTGGGTDGGTGGGGTGGSGTGGGGTGGGGTGGGSGVVGLVDYLYSASQSGGVTFQNLIAGASMTLFGAHHRPLMDFPQAGKNCGWITGDFGGGDRGDRRNYLGEVGICRDLGDSIRVGFGGGLGGSHQKLALGGRSETDGYHLVGEVDFRPAATPLLFSLTGYYADWDVDIARAYMNGATIDISRGSTKAEGWALRGRVDWKDALTFGDVGFSPYAAYTHAHVKLDGYTETGGAFPTIFNSSSTDSDEMRLGGVAAAPLTEKVTLRLSGEWVHRFDNAPAIISGTIIGIADFATATPTPNGDWGRAGADVDLKLSEKALLSLSGHTMLGQGEDARLSGSVSFRLAF